MNKNLDMVLISEDCCIAANHPCGNFFILFLLNLFLLVQSTFLCRIQLSLSNLFFSVESSLLFRIDSSLSNKSSLSNLVFRFKWMIKYWTVTAIEMVRSHGSRSSY